MQRSLVAGLGAAFIGISIAEAICT